MGRDAGALPIGSNSAAGPAYPLGARGNYIGRPGPGGIRSIPIYFQGRTGGLPVVQWPLLARLRHLCPAEPLRWLSGPDFTHGPGPNNLGLPRFWIEK